MGNCQTVDAAVLVIQHPDGKLERMHWPVIASEVMRKNPDHYVSLILPVPEFVNEGKVKPAVLKKSTHAKLLRPSETLNLGSAYRLVPSKEVLKMLRAKTTAKMNTRQVSPTNLSEDDTESLSESPVQEDEEKTTLENILKATRKRPRPLSKKPSVRRSKSWHPSLKTIAEIPSH